MATDTSLAAAADRFGRLERYLAGDLTPMAVGIATAAKKQALETARLVTASGGLSHMGRNGARLGAGYDITQRGRLVTIKFRPGGAWIILDTGARPHHEPRSGARSRRGKKSKTLRTITAAAAGHHDASDLDFGALARRRQGAQRGPSVNHPGMHGRAALKLAATRIERIVGPEGDKAVRQELSKIFGA